MSVLRALLASLLVASPLPAADEIWDLGHLLPDGRLAWVRVPDGASLARDLPAGLVDRAELPGPLGPLLREWDGDLGGEGFEALLGGPLELAVYETKGGRLSGKDGSRELLLAARPEDDRRARAALEDLIALCEASGLPGGAGEYRGVSYRRLGREVVVAWMDDALVVASDDDLLADAVDRSRDPSARRVSEAAPRDVELALTLEALKSKDFKGLRSARRKPVGRDALPALSLLLGPVGESLASEGWALGTLSHDAKAITLEASLPTTELAEHRPMPPVALPITQHTVASLALRVDLADVWRRREVLASDAMQPRLAKMDGAMTMLFAGRSLAEDVLGRLQPELGIVVDGKAFEPDDAVPALRLPAACLVARTADGAKGLLPLMVVAFQGALGAANLERAEDGHAPFLMRSLQHRGVTLHAARLLAGEGSGDGSEEDPLSADFNLTPCLALVGDHVLLGTSTAQVRRLVDALLDGTTQEHPGLVSLQADGAGLAGEMEAARAPLAGRLVLLQGLSAAAALEQVDRWIADLREVGQLDFGLWPEPGSLHAELSLTRPDGEG